MIGKRILEIRQKHNLTQKEFAEKINVSDKAVSKWESGLGDPSIDSLKVISLRFDVSLDELILGRDTSLNDNMSVLEKLAKNAKLSDIDEMIAKGIDLKGTDEFGNDIVDYFIKYPSDKLFQYLIDNKIIVLKTYFIINTKKAKKQMVFHEGYRFNDTFWNGTLNRGLAFEKDSRHMDLFNYLIISKQYDLIKQTLNFRDNSYTHKYEGLGRAWYADTWRLYGRIKLDLDEDTLKNIVSSNDTKLISIITGFDNHIQPQDFDKMSAAIDKYASKEIKLWFISQVIKYNEEAKKFNQDANERYKKEKKDRFLIAELKLEKWMTLVAISDKEVMLALVPYLTNMLMDEELIEKFAKKYDINLLPDSLTYKVNYLASNSTKKDFIEYINSFYNSNYQKFPILEVLKRLNEFPELEYDVIIYVYKLKDIHPPYTLLNNNIEFKVESYNIKKLRGLNFTLRPYGGARQVVVYNWPSSTLKRASFFEKKKFKIGKEIKLLPIEGILYHLAKHCTVDTLEVVNELFHKTEKESAMIKLIKEKDVKGIKNLIESDNKASEKYHFLEARSMNSNGNKIRFYHSISSKNVMELLADDTKLLADLIDVIQVTFLDNLLNQYTNDKDFEQIALLIDHGASLYSSYVTQQDDGWGYMEDVKLSQKDPKKTAVMREMIRNLDKK